MIAKKKRVSENERTLQKILCDFCWGISLQKSTIGLSMEMLKPFNPESILKDIEKVQRTLKKLCAWYHPDNLDEDTLNAMCNQLDVLSRQIYVAYASCKTTGVRELYIEDLRKLLGEVYDVVAPVLDKDKIWPKSRKQPTSIKS